MENPLIDQRHFEFQPWKQEMIWVQRNALGIIVGMSEKPPKSGDMVPTMATQNKGSEDKHANSNR